MYLTLRAAKPADLNSGFQLMTNRSYFSGAGARKDLLAFWRHLFLRQAAVSPVVVDHERGRKVVGFSLGFYATDEFTQALKTSLPPCAALQAVNWWRLRRLPYLGPQDVARANAREGVNALILHYGIENRQVPEEELQIRAKIFEGLPLLVGGLRLKEVLQEGFDEWGKKRIPMRGLLLRRDYHGGSDKACEELPPHPHLYGVTAEEAKARASDILPLFLVPRPRFGFPAPCQKVLHQALFGASDKEIAKGLGLSVWTVKKRWQDIYSQVEKKDPALLGPLSGEKNLSGEEPSLQRRRFFLDYLRHHLEEIRPYDPSQPRKADLVTAAE